MDRRSRRKRNSPEARDKGPVERKMKMKKRIAIIVVASVIVIVLLLCTVAYRVEYTKAAVVADYVTGETKAIMGLTDAGLKFKWPWPIQKVTIYPATMFTLEDAISEVQTSDHQKILVSAYCVWRIDNLMKFNESKATVESAEEALRSLLTSSKRAVGGRHVLGEFINTDPNAMIIPQIEREVLAPVKAHAHKTWGVDVVSVGIKTLGLPEGVTDDVIDAMKKEREKEAGIIRSEGENTADAIRARGKEAADKIIAFAKRKANSIESEGARAAAELYPRFSRNERFSMYLRNLRSLEAELSGRTVYVLYGPEIPAVRYFREGPFLPSPWPGGGKSPKKRK